MISYSRIKKGIEGRILGVIGNQKLIANYRYKCAFNSPINWKNPEDLNQWINWLEFCSDVSNWHLLADKYRVREYVTAKGFGGNLVPLIAKFDNPADININAYKLPLVLKMNNGCGDIIILKDHNNTYSNEELHNHFAPLFSSKYGLNTTEPHYTRIEPCLIAEEYLDASKQSISSSSLIDYKFWCFNGKPFCCFVCSNRTKQHFTIDLYTANKEWKRIEDGNLIYDDRHLKSKTEIPRPATIEQMIKIASHLSEGFPQMRVDLYEVNGKVYFGEITLTSMGGRMNYFSKEFLVTMGDLCRSAYTDLNKF